MATKLKRPMSFLLALVVAMVFNFPIGVTSGINGIFNFGMPAKAEGTIEPTQPKGSGTSADPYQIGTAAELYWFAAKVNRGVNTRNAKLTDNITVNEGVLDANGDLVEGTTNFIPWTPIGNDSYSYKGTFDGDGHTISGLYFNNPGQSYVGLFGYLGIDGKIKNVGVIDSYFNGNQYVGGVCGYNNCHTSSASYNNIIINCYNTSTVSGSGNYVGGVCGYHYSYSNPSISIIENCYNTGKVTGSGNYVGGVSGYNMKSTVKNCYNTGTVRGASYVGGVSGSNYNKSVIESCYNTGEVSGTSFVGSVCEDNELSTIINCYYFADSETDGISSTTYKTDEQFKNGEVCYLLNGSTAENERAWGQNLGSSPDDLPVLKNSTNNAPAVYKYCNRGVFGYSNDENKGNEHDFSTGQCKCGEYQPATLNGTYYEIDTVGKLYWFAAQVNSGNTALNAKLTDNITVNENVLNEDGTLADNASSFTVWTPIGNDSYKYTGIFDGDGHTISGLYLSNTNQSYVGLFGYVDSGTVKNVGVIDSYFNGNQYVGGVCGWSSGAITSCYNTGAVTGTSYVGGVCGNNSGTITNCYNAREGGNVCGNNSGTITNCYYLENTETDSFGGTTYKTEDQFKNGEVCYLLNGSTGTGDNLAWGQNVDTATDPKDAFPVLKNSTYNAPAVYKFCDGTNFGYSNENKGFTHDFTNVKCKCGDYQQALYNNEGSYYEIDTASKLYWFAAQVNSGNTTINAKLKADINVNGSSEEVNVANCNGKKGEGWTDWTPIGSNKSNPYKGTFDGAGRTINGLYFSNTRIDYVGLFGYVDSGTVKNVDVMNSYFNGREYVGGVCGYSKGTIISCCNTGKVTGNSYVGGVCGKNEGGTITYSSNKGAVKGSSGVGGVCGNNCENLRVGGIITTCYNTGAVTDTGSSSVGGVIGYNKDGTIEDCYNEGKVTGTGSLEGHAGGVIGSNGSGTITKCHNKGVVTGTNSSISRGMAYAGGVIGSNGSGTITSCYNKGEVTGTSMAYAGGVIGYNESGEITSCYNTSAITGNSNGYAGGVSGYNGSGSIASCYSTGAVSGKDYAGGVIGSNGSGTITSCYYDSKICKNMTAVGGDVADTADVTGKDTTAFTGGEVCYLLNGSKSDGTLVWGQRLGANASPVFYDRYNTVYLATGCQVYANTPTKDHVIGSDGSCSGCKQQFVRFNAESNKVTGWTNEVYQVLNGSEVDYDDTKAKTIKLKDGASLITCTFNHDDTITNVVYYTIEIKQGDATIDKTEKSKLNKTLLGSTMDIGMVQIAYMLENGDYTAILKLYDKNENELYTKTTGFSVTDTASE